MNMDYLDEETVVVKQSDTEVLGDKGVASIALGTDNSLKNRLQNIDDIQSFVSHENNLVNAGAELLSLCITVSRVQQPDDLYLFRQGLINAITELKKRIALFDYPPSVADKTCFLFCIVLDEQILHSDWSPDSGWENQTLVGELFGMRNGGEQFYSVADKALAQPNLLLDLIELIYIFLKIGFKGQYRLSGREKLDQIIEQLELVIFRARPATPKRIATQVEMPSSKHPARPARFFRQALLFLGGVALAWGATSYWYQNSLQQRARDFLTLPEFSKTYLNADDVKEVVYISTEAEMQVAAKVSATEQVKPSMTPINDPQNSGWFVQLATVNNVEQGRTFIISHSLQDFSATVVPWKSKYRVLIRATDKAEARNIAKKVRAKGIPDAFYIFSNQISR